MIIYDNKWKTKESENWIKIRLEYVSQTMYKSFSLGDGGLETRSSLA